MWLLDGIEAEGAHEIRVRQGLSDGGIVLESGEENGLIIARLDEGEDLVQGINDIAKKHGLENGLILFGIGMLEDASLGYFDGERYIEKRFEGDYELVALHGTIANSEIHIHLALGTRDCETVSGHLLGAKVKVQVELVMQKLDKIGLTRIQKGAVKTLGFE
jgi:predicted DNA-binding protein with PD1-like motif